MVAVNIYHSGLLQWRWGNTKLKAHYLLNCVAAGA
jgi:hypothetical protein